MDPISNLITENKIPIGQWGEELFMVLTTYLDWFFDGLSTGITATLEALIAVILWPPPILMVVLVAAVAWFLHRSWALAVGIVVGLLFIINQGYWREMAETLSLVIGATAVSMAIGVPVGIAAAHRPWLYQALRPILDLMQTLPTFVYLIPALILFGLGLAPGLISTVIFAVPAPIRLTHLGISSVPNQLIEAGEAFGATKRQLLWKVELPAARQTIMAGFNQCIMLSLSMVVIAALVGAAGLGVPVLRALNQVKIPMGIEAGLSIVVLAIILDRLLRAPTGGGEKRR
jgi:glycine betaine/proline transport system permease protein